MGDTDPFLDFLKRKRDAAPSAPDAKQSRDEWLKALDDLYHSLNQYLGEAQQQGLLEVSASCVVLDDALLGGPYRAPALRIQDPTKKVVAVEPVGRHIVGALGRVDLRCDSKHIMLVRFRPNEWHFSWLPSTSAGWQSLPLSRDSFLRVLQQLLD